MLSQKFEVAHGNGLACLYFKLQADATDMFDFTTSNKVEDERQGSRETIESIPIKIIHIRSNIQIEIYCAREDRLLSKANP